MDQASDSDTIPDDRRLDLDRRYLDLREREIEDRRREAARGGWRNPLVVAVLAAAVAAGGNAVVSLLEGVQDRQLEAEQAENARILEMIKTGDADRAAENLQFLLDAGLIDSPQRVAAVAAFLEERQPGTGPTLAAPGSPFGIIGRDDASVISEAPPMARILGEAVGVLIVQGPSDPRRCTAFLTGPRQILTAAFCLAGADAATFALAPEQGAGLVHEVVLPPEMLSIGDPREAGPVRLDLRAAADLPVQPLVIAEEPPREGAPAGIIHFRGDLTKRAVWNESCRVALVGAETFDHTCDTGAGTAGSPVLDRESGAVIGVHASRTDGGGTAFRVSP